MLSTGIRDRASCVPSHVEQARSRICHSAKRRGQNAHEISGLHEALHAVRLISLAAKPPLFVQSGYSDKPAASRASFRLLNKRVRRKVPSLTVDTDHVRSSTGTSLPAVQPR